MTVAQKSADPQARGRLAFVVHCARCHGPGGRGDGPDAASLRPPPRDLTSAPWRTPVTAESVALTLARGIPDTMMPALGPALSTRERESIIGFVMSIAPKIREAGALPENVARLVAAAGLIAPTGDRVAPPFRAAATPSGEVTRDGLRGKLMVLSFWGTSCAPCVKEFPDLQRLADRHRDAGLVVVPVCVDETDPETVRRMADGYAPGMPVYLDPTGALKLAYDVQTLPTTVLIGPDGRLIARAQGAVPWSSPQVEALLGAVLPGRP